MDTARDCTWPEMKQRAHYLGWLAVAVATATLLGLTIDLLVVALTGGNVGTGLIPLLYLSVIVPPYVYAWRKHGEQCCHFLELEHAMEESFHAPPGRTAHFLELLRLMERIEQGRGMERQLVRNETKAWLLAHAEQLSREERAYVADHLGYLHKA